MSAVKKGMTKTAASSWQVQRRLSTTDPLNEYLSHASKRIFACPTGVSGPADHWGSAIFG
jgi:deferrochelatase/peroxidase EfeB